MEYLLSLSLFIFSPSHCATKWRAWIWNLLLEVFDSRDSIQTWRWRERKQNYQIIADEEDAENSCSRQTLDHVGDWFLIDHNLDFEELMISHFLAGNREFYATEMQQIFSKKKFKRIGGLNSTVSEVPNTRRSVRYTVNPFFQLMDISALGNHFSPPLPSSTSSPAPPGHFSLTQHPHSHSHHSQDHPSPTTSHDELSSAGLGGNSKELQFTPRKRGRAWHPFTKFIVVVGKQNSKDENVQCLKCVENLGASKAKIFINRSQKVLDHLLKCPYMDKSFADEFAHMEEKKLEPKQPKQRKIEGSPLAPNCFDVWTFQPPQQTQAHAHPHPHAHLQTQTQTLAQPPSSHPVVDWSKEFHRLALHMMISNGVHFSFLEEKSTQELLKFLNPTAEKNLPSRSELYGRILQEEVFEVEKQVKTCLMKYGAVTLCIEGWRHSRTRNVLGINAMLPDGSSFLISVQPQVNKRLGPQETLNLVEEILTSERLREVKITAFVLGSSCSFTLPLQQLRASHPERVFLPCFAHQVALTLGDVFKCSPLFLQILSRCLIIIEHFDRSPADMKLLREKQVAIHGKTSIFFYPRDKKWKSQHECVMSILRNKRVLQVGSRASFSRRN